MRRIAVPMIGGHDFRRRCSTLVDIPVIYSLIKSRELAISADVAPKTPDQRRVKEGVM